MGIKSASVIIWNGKAYIPSVGKTKSGLTATIKPVQIVNPILIDILPIVKQLITHDPIALQDLSEEEILEIQELLPKITGAGTWPKLCKKGISYNIFFSDERGYLIEMSTRDSKGRWAYDPLKKRILPPNTDLINIIELIISDMMTRSE